MFTCAHVHNTSAGVVTFSCDSAGAFDASTVTVTSTSDAFFAGSVVAAFFSSSSCSFFFSTLSDSATASLVVVSIFSVFAAILSRVYSLGSSESTSTTSFLGSAWIARFFGVDDFELGDCCLLGVASASAGFSVRFGVVDAPRARLDGGVAVTAAVVGVAPRALDRVRRRPSSRSTETPSDFSSSSLSF
uniref:Uncharacterized protein n=1 Tax=Anopheles melas TaxID=34690 RepID=A0A182UEU9_9DIPT